MLVLVLALALPLAVHAFSFSAALTHTGLEAVTEERLRANDECCRRVSFFHRNIEYDNDGEGYPVHYNTSADFAGDSSSFHVDFEKHENTKGKSYIYNSHLGVIWITTWDGKCYQKGFPAQPKCIPDDGHIIGSRRLAWSYPVDVWQFHLKSPHPDARMLYHAVTQDGVCNPIFSDAHTPTQQLAQLFSYDSVLKTFDPSLFDEPEECRTASRVAHLSEHPELHAEVEARVALLFPS